MRCLSDMVTRCPGIPCPGVVLGRRAERCVRPGESSTELTRSKSTFGHGAKGLFILVSRGLKSPSWPSRCAVDRPDHLAPRPAMQCARQKLVRMPTHIGQSAIVGDGVWSTGSCPTSDSRSGGVHFSGARFLGIDEVAQIHQRNCTDVLWGALLRGGSHLRTTMGCHAALWM
jgi:hypothetical protein